MTDTRRKRGRPPFEQQTMLDVVKLHYIDIHSRRGLQNKVYENLAIFAIGETNDTELMDFFCKTEKTRHIVLAEIGRLPNYSLMQEMARQVYESYKAAGDLSAKDWVKVIRRARKEWAKSNLGNGFLKYKQDDVSYGSRYSVR